VSSNGDEVIYTASWIRNGAVVGSAEKSEKKPVSGNNIEGVSIDYASISEDGISIGAGRFISGLKVLVSPVGAVSGNALWKSDNEGIARVRASKENGTGTIMVEAVDLGVTTIKAYIDGSDVAAFAFPVTVFDPSGLIIRSDKSVIYPETVDKRFIITTLNPGDYTYSLPGDLKGMKGKFLQAALRQ
ncbi:MAG: hypothetical protein IJT24_02735, partial [Lachnospiraceae bacterium]|nr:hypothetical protein [Lachnospiraceae bacterium]